MANGTCRIGEGDCSKTGKLTAGWCPKHYQRLRKHGDSQFTKRIKGDDDARFWSKVDRRGPDECWLWAGGLDIGGYGVFSTGGKIRKAHVWAYERFVGPVPEDKPDLDHACHSQDDDCPGGICAHRRCVNFTQFSEPGRLHLEPVTEAENARRAHRARVPGTQISLLHARYLAGESAAILGAEVGMRPRTLTTRFWRMRVRGDLPPGKLQLSPEQVIELHARWKAGVHIDVLAAETGATRATIYKRFSRLAAESH